MPAGATMAAATVGSALIGSSAAKSAAKTESQAAQQAAAIQQQMYAQTRSDLSPYRDLGASSSSAYAKLLGLDQTGAPIQAPKIGDVDPDAFLAKNPDVAAYWNATPEAQKIPLQDFAKQVATQQAGVRGPAPTYNSQTILNWRSPQESALEQTPGYQFTRDQGIQEVSRAVGSRGLTGAQAKGIARFVTGLADKTYGDAVGRLGSATTIGANAAAGGGQIGAQTGQNIGNNIVGAGQASAAGTVGAANAVTAGLGSLGQYAYANKILGMYGGGTTTGGALPSGYQGLV